MHIEDRLYADIGHNGGLAFFGPALLMTDTPATTPGDITTGLAAKRIAAGEWALSTSKQSTAMLIGLVLPNLRRIIESYTTEGAFQQQFGGTLGPQNAPGRPPFTGVSQLASPTTTGPAKGLQIDDIVVYYRIATNNLAAASARLDKTLFVNAVAPASSAIAIAATAFPLVAAATPYLVKRAVTNPAYITNDNAGIILEFAVTTPGAAFQLDVHGVGFHYHFNYN